jgi:hypothetical protein
MTSSPANTLILENVQPVKGGAEDLGAAAPGGAHSSAVTLLVSPELQGSDHAISREQARYLREVATQSPDELAESLHQLRTLEAQLEFEKSKNLALTQELATQQTQIQMVGVGALALLFCVLFGLLLRRRQARPRAKKNPLVMPVQGALQAEEPQTNDEERDSRIQEVWADSQDWLSSDAGVMGAESLLPADALRADDAAIPQLRKEVPRSDMLGKEPWQNWEQDAQPQPQQSLVDYLRSLHRMLQRLLDAGRLKDARALLYAHIRLVSATSPWAYLVYFALQTENSAQYQEVRTRFADAFGRSAPALGDDGQSGFMQKGLADYQYSLTQLTQAWPTERAVLLLETWLSPHKRRTFTLQAYEDLFVLYDVLDQLHGV